MKKNLTLTKAQAWLNQWYPNQESREYIYEINVDKKVDGRLVIENFPRLKKITCKNNSITGLVVENCPELEIINCLDNKIVELKLANLPKLLSVEASSNKIISPYLIINNCPNIERLRFCDNDLINLNFLRSIDEKKLLFLDVGSNNIEKQDLSIFSGFTNR